MFVMDEFLKSAGGGVATQLFEESFAKAGGVFQPSSGDAHIDVALTNISLAIMQDAGNFVARRAMRTVAVNQRSNVYWTYPRGAFNRDQMQRRAPGTESVGVNYQVDTARYFCDVYAAHVNIADMIRDNADAAINLDRDNTLLLTMKSMLREEIDWRDKFFPNTAVAPDVIWAFVGDGVASSPTALGSLDFRSSTAGNRQVLKFTATPSTGEEGPIELFRRCQRTMQSQTGFRPNVGVTSRAVVDTLLDHPDIVARIDNGQTPGGPANVTLQNLANLLDFEEIIVMEGIVNTAGVGLPDVHDFIAGDHFLMLYRPASAGLMTPAPGYTFLWSGFRGANSGGMRIKNIRDDLRESDRIEIQAAWEHNLVAPELGFMLFDVL